MSKRRNPPLILKKRLIEEAANKCANPGCPNYLIEIHHIKEWHVYKTHDGAHMIAICPSCHDAVTRGDLRIDDEALYNWKKIIRNPFNRDHIYVEPSSPVCLLLGSIAVETSNNLVVFELPNNCKLSFEVIYGDIALVDLVIKAPNGDTLVSMVKNFIEYKLTVRVNLDAMQRF